MGMFIYGCSTLAIIPTTTNPALEQVVGLKVPHVKMLGLKVTLQGFNDGLEALADFEHDITYPAGRSPQPSLQSCRLRDLVAVVCCPLR